MTAREVTFVTVGIVVLCLFFTGVLYEICAEVL
jgi:hypothetical protein